MFDYTVAEKLQLIKTKIQKRTHIIEGEAVEPYIYDSGGQIDFLSWVLIDLLEHNRLKNFTACSRNYLTENKPKLMQITRLYCMLH